MASKTHGLQFSIVIPTRNRLDTFHYCLSTCLEQMNFDNYEIIIDDASDNDATKDYVERRARTAAADRALLRYYRREQACGTSTFNDVLARVDGEYIIVISDDDGLLPMALFEISELIKKTGAGIIKWRSGLYHWPAQQSGNAADHLSFSITRSYRALSGRDELKQSMQTLQHENLPMLYINAAVQRHIVELLRGQDARIYRGPAPDIYSSVVLSYICGQFIDTSVPLSLVGLPRSHMGDLNVFGDDVEEFRTDFDDQDATTRGNPAFCARRRARSPAEDFAESFYHAKTHHFPQDSEFVLLPTQSTKARARQHDVDDGTAIAPLFGAFRDDEYAMETKTHSSTEQLGMDRGRLRLDPRDFDVTDISGAVKLVHRIVWPNDAPLRYDLA